MFLFAGAITINAQTIKGKVTDTSGEALSFMNVVEKGTTNGTTTDENGEFSLDVKQMPTTISVSSLGFKTVDKSIVDASYVSIVLEDSNLALDEVVLVGSRNKNRTVSNTPVPVDVIDTTNLNVGNTLHVEGGSAGNLLSQFDGPVLFNSKVTATGDLEAGSLFLQGAANVSRKYTVGISTPTTAGTAGDVIWKAAPTGGKNWGWVYTTQNRWHPFGFISADPNLNIGIFDQVGIATTSPGDCTLIVGSGTSLFVRP